MTELIKPINYREIVRTQQKEIKQLQNRLDGMKAVIISIILFLIGLTSGAILAIRDIQTKPVTVLLENQVQELDKLPLPPLEEINIK